MAARGCEHISWWCRAQRDYLTQKLEEVDAQLREAKADRKESERDRRTTEAVEQLKRLFSGVSCLLLAWGIPDNRYV